MAIIVIDAFTGECSFHGKQVSDIIKKYYKGDIIEIDTGKCSLSWESIYQILKDILDKVESGEYENITAINMSYGGGETSNPKYWNTRPEWYDLWKNFFDNNIVLCFPSENTSSWESTNWDGVSLLASSPYVFATSAIDIHYDKVEGDCKIEIPSYAEYEENIISYLASGYSLENSIGTSFSSPKTCAIYANLMEKGLTIPEIDIAYRVFSEPVKGKDGFWYWTLDIDEMLSLSEPIEVTNSEVLVWDLYYLILGRKPDPEGLDFWTNLMEFTGNSDEIIKLLIDNAIANGDIERNGVPIKDKIEAFYEFFFGREPDMQGLSHWMDVALHSETWDEVFIEIYEAGKANRENLYHENFFDDVLEYNDSARIGIAEIDHLIVEDYFTLC